MIEDVKSTNYRPEIDGIRAIAICLVVLFHAFRGWMPGGFIGVDVFFVISGYLISTLILDHLKTDRFTFAGFYAGRFRRLMPALTLVLLCVWGAGWFVLLADEFESLGQHLISGATFTTNFRLWAEAGYFDAVAETKPLLHLWSLGIEEQFYIAWPLLLVFWVKKKLPFSYLVIFGFGASFLANVLSVHKQPVETFYFLPFRFWELMIGCGLACYESERDRIRIPGILADLFCVAAVAALIYMAKKFQVGSPFPGVWALVPTLSTLLLLIAGRTGWLPRRILASRPFVLIGKISYPLYLWHWPLLSFAVITGEGVATWPLRAGLVALSILLAWCTWRFVELPVKARLFSSSDGLRRSRLFIFSGLAAIGITAALGFVTFQQEGFAFRVRQFDQVQLSLRSGARPEMQSMEDGCALSDSDRKLAFWCRREQGRIPNAAIIGDSHAASLFPGLVANAPPAVSWTLVANPGCPPFQELAVNEGIDCPRFNRAVLIALEKNREIKTVILTTARRNLMDLDSELVFHGLSVTIGRLLKAGKRVIFTLDNPTIEPTPRLCVSRPVRFEHLTNPCRVSKREFLSQTAQYRVMVSRLQRSFPKLTVYDPTPVLCDESYCSALFNGLSMYTDSDHLSDVGANQVGRDLMRQYFGNALSN